MALRWLLLCGLPRTGHETVYGHGFSGHHIFTTIRFGIRKVSNINGKLLSFLRESLGFSGFFGLCGFLLDGSFFLNKCVSKFSETSGHALNRLVPQWREFVRISISPTQLPSFSHCKFRRKKICVPNVNV